MACGINRFIAETEYERGDGQDKRVIRELKVWRGRMGYLMNHEMYLGNVDAVVESAAKGGAGNRMSEFNHLVLAAKRQEYSNSLDVKGELGSGRCTCSSQISSLHGSISGTQVSSPRGTISGFREDPGCSRIREGIEEGGVIGRDTTRRLD